MAWPTLHPHVYCLSSGGKLLLCHSDEVFPPFFLKWAGVAFTAYSNDRDITSNQEQFAVKMAIKTKSPSWPTD
jgi:hypothetical protein